MLLVHFPKRTSLRQSPVEKPFNVVVWEEQKPAGKHRGSQRNVERELEERCADEGKKLGLFIFFQNMEVRKKNSERRWLAVSDVRVP